MRKEHLPHPKVTRASPDVPASRNVRLACMFSSILLFRLQDSFSSSACRTPRARPTQRQVSPCTRPCRLLDPALSHPVQAFSLPRGQGRVPVHQPQRGGTVSRGQATNHVGFWPLTSGPRALLLGRMARLPLSHLVVASGETQISGICPLGSSHMVWDIRGQVTLP